MKDLKGAGFAAVGVVPDGEKPIRASIQVEKFAKRSGLLSKPSETWLADFETELLAFPHGRYDDQIDALIQGLAYERPTGMCDDAALKGLERFTYGLWLAQMRGV